MRFANRLADPAYDATLDDPEDEMFDAAWAARRRRPLWDWLTRPWRSLDSFDCGTAWLSPSEAAQAEPMDWTDWGACWRDVSPWWVRVLRWIVADARVAERERLMPTPPRGRSSRTS